jgi:hypothetical protein
MERTIHSWTAVATLRTGIVYTGHFWVEEKDDNRIKRLYRKGVH